MQVLSYCGRRKPTLLRVARNCNAARWKNFVLLCRGRHFSCQGPVRLQAVFGQCQGDLTVDPGNQRTNLRAHKLVPGAGGGAVTAVNPAVAISHWRAARAACPFAQLNLHEGGVPLPSFSATHYRPVRVGGGLAQRPGPPQVPGRAGQRNFHACWKGGARTTCASVAAKEGETP